MNSRIDIGKRHEQGMSLLELLVSLALIGIVLAAVLSVVLQSNRASMRIQAQSELTSETQIAQNYMVSKIRKAVYIFPVSSSTSFFQINAGGYSTLNPVARAGVSGTGNHNWRLATGTLAADPFVAFVLPPAAGGRVGANACRNSSTDQAKELNCYAFYAYYAVPRSLISNGNGSDIPIGPNKLTPDPINDNNVWVLMEYRAYYTASGYSTSTNPSSGAAANDGIPGGSSGRIVLDYVQPTTEINADKLFISSPATAKVITVNLATTRRVGKDTVSVPATGRLSVNVYPRNIGMADLSN